MVELVIAPAGELAVLAADAIEALLRRDPEAVIGLATGSSPLAVYDELARRHDESGLSFEKARGFLLDEYLGLPPGHPQRYRNVVQQEVTARVGWPADRVQGPDDLAADLETACAAYERALEAAGGVDLQLLGIGTDGHLAFNEPGTPFASRTHVEALTRQTREDNARFFDGDAARVPTHCLTQGLGTIAEARRLVLLATGDGKAEAVRHLVEGPVTTAWPCTAVRNHPHATLLVDRAAASQLSSRH